VYQATGRPELRASLANPNLHCLGWRSVGANVLFLGLTSLVTDISSEMVTSAFPLYLVLHLQFSPLAFGAVDGLHQGGATLARLASGFVSDRFQRYREVAALGYASSAIAKLGLLVVGRSLPGVMTTVVADRLGKGIRTSPRDALISLSAPREGLAAAFGVHRALDTTGAMLGPLVTFAILAWLPHAYDVVFVVSFALALIGVAILWTFVRNPPPRPAVPSPGPPALADAVGLAHDRRVRFLVMAGAALGTMTLSDGFLYLLLQQRLRFSESYLPLLFVATPSVYLCLAYPMGRLADRVGRGTVVVGGYAVLLGVYLGALAGPPRLATLAACVLLLGVYYAATDGVLMALSSAVLPRGLRATGLGLVTTANGAARVVASVGFGWLWTTVSLPHAVGMYGAGLMLVLAFIGPRLWQAHDGGLDA
jgi:MFS family permease